MMILISTLPKIGRTRMSLVTEKALLLDKWNTRSFRVRIQTCLLPREITRSSHKSIQPAVDPTRWIQLTSKYRKSIG